MCVQNKYQYFFMITKHLIDVWIGWFRWHFAYKAKGLERAAHFYAYQIDTINNVIKSYLQNKSIFSYYYLWVLCVCVCVHKFVQNYNGKKVVCKSTAAKRSMKTAVKGKTCSFFVSQQLKLGHRKNYPSRVNTFFVSH